MVSSSVKSLLATVALVSLVGVMAAAPGRATGQSRIHLVLVAPPLPGDQADSAFALTLADRLRRVISQPLERRAVPFRDMCRILRASDYSCRKLMQEEEVAQLAAALSADAYLTSRITRDPNVHLELRITSRGRVGYAGAIAVDAEPATEADSIVTLAKKGLEDLWVAAARARACYEARDARQYAEAIHHAKVAQSHVPNHSAAALCWASVFELTDQPVDSLIKAYGQAVAGDPRLTDIRSRLGMLHLQVGDTASANLHLAENLNRDPSDARLRALVAVNWVAAGEPDSAFGLLHAGTETGRENLDLLQILARVCLDKELWDCEYEALKRQYQLDSGLAGDTTFYYRIIGAAQSLDDAASVLQWTNEAARHVQQTIDEAERVARDSYRTLRSLRMAHAAALGDVGERDSAVALYLRLWGHDTTDVRPFLAAAETLADPRFLGIDSATALDTAALREADSLLTALTQQRDDDAVLQTVATIYFTPAAALVQAHIRPDIASAWFEKALSYDVEGLIHETASSLNGLALFYIVQQLDAQIREQPHCDLVDRADDAIVRARAATLVGEHAFPDVAQQVLQGLDAYARFIPQYREILRCHGGTPALGSVQRACRDNVR